MFSIEEHAPEWTELWQEFHLEHIDESRKPSGKNARRARDIPPGGSNIMSVSKDNTPPPAIFLDASPPM